MPVRIYDPEKTVADCFRYRNQLGMEVVLEAMRLWRDRRRKKLDVLPLGRAWRAALSLAQRR